MPYAGAKGYLAPAQAAVRFCLLPETFEAFLAWLRKDMAAEESPEWFEPDSIRADLLAVRDLLRPIEEALIKASVFPDLEVS